jgi:hypothetical protein
MEKIQNCIAFKTIAFDTTLQRDYFIHSSCFGDDAARWIMVEFGIHGFHTDDTPSQRDFGWDFKFDAAGANHAAVIGYRPGSYGGEGEWICWVERKTGLTGKMLKMDKNINPEAAKAIQDVLSSSPAVKVVKVCDVREL